MKSTINRRWPQSAGEPANDAGYLNGPPASMMNREVPRDPLKWVVIGAFVFFVAALASFGLKKAAADYHWHIGRIQVIHRG